VPAASCASGAEPTLDGSSLLERAEACPPKAARLSSSAAVFFRFRGAGDVGARPADALEAADAPAMTVAEAALTSAARDKGGGGTVPGRGVVRGAAAADDVGGGRADDGDEAECQSLARSPPPPGSNINPCAGARRLTALSANMPLGARHPTSGQAAAVDGVHCRFAAIPNGTLATPVKDLVLEYVLEYHGTRTILEYVCMSDHQVMAKQESAQPVQIVWQCMS
jgi:hypothetical protein